MRALDDKLKLIILGLPDPEGGISPTDMDEGIAHIKQAFADAGYETELKQPFEKGWNAGYQTSDYVCKHSKHMTGQEWYDRFDKALDEILMDLTIRGDTRDLVYLAAKRASGLDL